MPKFKQVYDILAGKLKSLDKFQLDIEEEILARRRAAAEQEEIIDSRAPRVSPEDSIPDPGTAKKDVAPRDEVPSKQPSELGSR